MTASCINDETTLRVIEIIEGTTVDGPGLRTSIYVAGCLHDCPGCHNPATHSLDAGRDMTVSRLLAIVDEAGMNVTISGGDPVYQADSVTILAQALKASGRNVWLYTGFTYERLMATDKGRRLLEQIDVLVDGPYIESLRDTQLLFRGSSNQRLIDLRRSTPEKPVIWRSSF